MLRIRPPMQRRPLWQVNWCEHQLAIASSFEDALKEQLEFPLGAKAPSGSSLPGQRQKKM